LAAVIFPDWSQLQQEAHIVDVQYRREKGLDNKSPPFVSHYVLSNLVDLMDLHISVGVELSLYQSHEDLSVVYWYRDFLLSALLNNLSAMQKTKLSGQKGPAQQGEPSGKSNKGKKKNHGKRERNGSSQQSGLEELEYEYDMMVLECKRSLCRGLVRVSFFFRFETFCLIGRSAHIQCLALRFALKSLSRLCTRASC